jgi:hypothetical protein
LEDTQILARQLGLDALTYTKVLHNLTHAISAKVEEDQSVVVLNDATCGI